MEYLKLVKSGKRRSPNGPLYRCPVCSGTVTVTLRLGGEIVKGKRIRATREDVCLTCLLEGKTPYK